MVNSLVYYYGFLVLLAVQRAAELWLSRRNVERLLSQGAREHASWQVPWMSGLHALWFGSCAVEAAAGARFSETLFVPAAVCFLLGQGLRYAAIYALRGRWNVRIMTLDSPPVRTGIYRIIRHPNYAGVALEIAAVPLLHGAWLTAVVFSILNGIFLFLRIRAENKAVYG